jgi:hypothetical protein
VGEQWFDTTNAILYTRVTDGTDAAWVDITSANGAALPTQANNSGKYLTTDGSSSSWAAVSGGSSSVPFYKSDGTQDNIALSSGELPFYKADGTQDNIGVI